MRERITERIRQWPVTDIGGWPLVNESSNIWRTSRKWIVAKWKKTRIAFEIWNAIPRVEKNKICVAVQSLETIRFILFRDDPFMSGKSNVRRFIYERSATNIRDWTLAYSFIWLTDRLIFTYLLYLSHYMPICSCWCYSWSSCFPSNNHVQHSRGTSYAQVHYSMATHYCLIFQRLQKIRHIQNQKALLDSRTME